MNTIEKFNWVHNNKANKSQKEMAVELNISYSMVGHLLYRYTNNSQRQKNVIKHLPPIQMSILKKIKSINDYSTNGNFDIKKWAKCLPV